LVCQRRKAVTGKARTPITTISDTSAVKPWMMRPSSEIPKRSCSSR